MAMARAKSCKLRKAALAVAWSLGICSARAAVVKPAPREKTSGAGKRNEPATRAIFRSFSIGTPGVLGIVIPDDIDFERIGEPAAESRGGHSGGYADTVRTRITQPAAGQEEQDEPRKRPAVPAVSGCFTGATTRAITVLNGLSVISLVCVSLSRRKLG